MWHQQEHWALTGCILMGFSVWPTHRKGPRSRGRTKGGRSHQLESTLAEKCVPTPGPSEKTPPPPPAAPENCPYVNTLSWPYWGQLTPSSPVCSLYTILLFHTYFVSSTHAVFLITAFVFFTVLVYFLSSKETRAEVLLDFYHQNQGH